MKLRSLTAKLAALFACVSFAVMGTSGYVLYRVLEKQLLLRDDAALVTRVDQIRTLLQDSDLLDLIHDKPQLFANMLGNREALLVLRFPGQAPVLEVNPAHRAVPQVDIVDVGHPLGLSAVLHTTGDAGVPFIAAGAKARVAGDPRDLEIIAGRTMTERTRLLASYRDEILALACGAAMLIAALAFLTVRTELRPLRKLARETESIGVHNLSFRLDESGAPKETWPLIAAINAMLERLEKGFIQLSQVSADMSHDLRTPIGNLLGQTEVALRQPRSSEYYEALLASNFEELERLSKMIDNMLFLARAEHAGTAVDVQPCDIASEFERMADYFEGPAFERGMEIRANGAGTAHADPDLLRRALANLLSNAVKYGYEGTVIRLEAVHAAGGTKLSVESAGPTIDSLHLSRLFERFYRADDARRDSAQSSGLGLSIVRSIMVLHRGQCMVHSESGMTRFTLRFPSRPAQAGTHASDVNVAA
jgi:two-component system heavy metal sensor histidine kinase CusS